MIKRAVIWLFIMVFFGIASACEKENSLVIDYFENFEQIDLDEGQVIFVLPKYACTFCTKTTFDWLENSKGDKAPWIITDNKLYEGMDKVLVDANKDRLEQYKPFVSKAYVSSVKDGEVISIKEIGLGELGNLAEIFAGMINDCPPIN
jgi:hypothetical protein